MKTKISVAMAAYNGEKFISDQIESIIKQLSYDDELVISLNNSTDSTEAIINSYFKDNRVKLFKCEEKGIIANFENAIKNCKGDIIVLSDQDDIWLDNKLLILKEYYNNNDCIAVIHDCSIVDENLNCIENSFYKYNHSKKGFIKNLVKNSYIGCCMSFKKELIAEILPIPRDVPMHDQWIGLIAELEGNVTFLDKVLLLYRRHSSNASKLKRSKIVKMLSNRIKLLYRILYVRLIK